MANKIDTNERTEQIKKLLISEQEGIAPNEQIINDLIEGKIKLLSAKDIYTRLNISSGEFEQLVKHSDPTYSLHEKNKMDAFTKSLIRKDLIKAISRTEIQYKYSFPKPDLYIAGKARWSPDTLKRWLLQGAK
ncbi:hypothetical protein [Haemophilus influenzae]|uniref:DNA-binding protein n=1 Tax=Haemophilus influenzae TaxID=727 RepID=A0AAX3ITR1_HAEIF|nr:hypothetical protein [Haemophilus influenzae]MCK9053423.1 hypothetical protein [Haemophilus influenzae]BBF07655.1 hypothetical protein CHBNIII7_15380 [Haemophilus influenzae]VTX73087.1 Uncharacterised protein [Haemophilus influenzae]